VRRTAVAGALILAACTPSTPHRTGGQPGSLPPTFPPVAATVGSPPVPPAPAMTPAAPVFAATIVPLPSSVRTKMTGRSWRPGCPVGLDDLRFVTMSYWGFDQTAHTGQMVLHRSYADAVVRVFRYLFAVRFPIQRMQLVDDFGADDAASMAADNTSAYNCRGVEGSPGVWSQHSYGWAVDINPVQNPWVRGTTVEPPAGLAYVDRSKQADGMIHSGDVVVDLFSSIGWTWGGTFRSAQDYQHFSATGR
jgi:hypothetical protein